MPKILVGIISAAFSLTIGFVCGALLTAPENSQMEALLQKNEDLKKQMDEITAENDELYDQTEILKDRVQNLKDTLLQTYEQRRQLERRNSELVYPE